MEESKIINLIRAIPTTHLTRNEIPPKQNNKSRERPVVRGRCFEGGFAGRFQILGARKRTQP